MANLALLNNNPGNLTVNSPGQILYVGQTGTYQSSNGFIYAVFGTAQDGWNALTSYIQRHVASGSNTTTSLLGLFGAPTTGANAANPNPGSYTANFLSASGLQAGQSLIGVDPNTVAIGIATAEGAKSIIPVGAGSASGVASSSSPFPTSPKLSGSGAGAASLEPARERGLRRALFHLLKGKQALERAGVSTPSKQSLTQSQGSGKVSAERLVQLSKPQNRSASTPALASSGLSSSSSASLPSSGPMLRTAPSLSSLQPQPERKANMSEVSDYIESHVNFLNAFLPALKVIVDELPLSPAVKVGFDTAYSLAPVVITTGAAALSALQGGKAQPAAMDVATAFSEAAPAPTPEPAPVPTGPVSIIPPPPAPAPVAPAIPPVLVQLNQPTASQPPPPVSPLNPPQPPAPTVTATVPDPGNPAQTMDVGQLAALVASLGYQVVGPGGQVIPPGP